MHYTPANFIHTYQPKTESFLADDDQGNNKIMNL